MRDYRLVKVMSVDENVDPPEVAIAVLDHPEYGRDIWPRCKVRKTWECQVSQSKINSGDTAYRPMTNGNNRMHRISKTGMAWLVRDWLDGG